MANPGEPKEVCDEKIKECDVFVGIYAHRYGFIPDNQTKSITQLEYELAKDQGKDCLCFIVKKTGSGKLFYRSTTSHGSMKTSHDFQYKFRLEPFF